jgi:hypothetical protein
MAERMNLLQGTLDLPILRSVSLEQMHGLGKAPSSPHCSVSNRAVGSCPFGESPKTTGRPGIYALTKAGGMQLHAETAEWNRISQAMSRALQTS